VADDTARKGPLDGIRVIDLTLALAGPLCTQRLGDLGAEVIKIEGPGRPDFTRNAPMLEIRLGGETIPYLSLNRNKKSLALDLKSPAGLDILMRLVSGADVVIQNMRPGVAERLGITFEALKAANERIVYVDISGYGPDETMRDIPGQDLLVQALSGTTFNAGRAGDLPHPSPIYIVDVAASHNACEAVLAGIIQRDRQDVAVHASVSLLEAVLEVQIQEITSFLTTGDDAPRSNAPYASTWMEPPYGIYEVRDGHVALAQSSVPKIAEVLGSSEIAEAFARRPARAETEAFAEWRDEMHAIISAAVAGEERDSLVARLHAAGIWCGPVLDYREFWERPQARDLVVSMHHPKAGEIRTLRPAISFEGAGEPTMRPAPLLGQDSTDVLGGLGLTPDEIEALRRRGVVA